MLTLCLLIQVYTCHLFIYLFITAFYSVCSVACEHNAEMNPLTLSVNTTLRVSLQQHRTLGRTARAYIRM